MSRTGVCRRRAELGARQCRAEAPNDRSGAGHHPDTPGAELGFRPVNDLEHVLLRCVLSGARATLLRALARSTLCVPALPGATGAAAGPTGSGRRVG